MYDLYISIDNVREHNEKRVKFACMHARTVCVHSVDIVTYRHVAYRWTPDDVNYSNTPHALQYVPLYGLCKQKYVKTHVHARALYDMTLIMSFSFSIGCLNQFVYFHI